MTADPVLVRGATVSGITPSQSRQSSRFFGGVLIVLSLSLSACGRSVDPMMPYWDGQLPLEERQSIEVYQRDVEPLFGEVLVGLQGLGLKEASLLGQSHIDTCGGVGVDGYELVGTDVTGTPLNTDAAKALVGLILMGKGFDYVYDDRDEISDTVRWFSTADGGYFSLTIKPGSHTAFRYISGCRPSDGSAKDVKADRVTPEWERVLPEFIPEATPGTFSSHKG